jgi:hypothetical protein
MWSPASPRIRARNQDLSLPGLTGQSSNPCVIDVAGPVPQRESGGYWIARSSRAMTGYGGCYLKISSVSGLSRKLLQELNRIGQFEMATICGISAVSVM